MRSPISTEFIRESASKRLCVTVAPIRTYLMRRCSLSSTPEGRLWVEAIAQGWVEACGSVSCSESDREAAQRFFTEGRADLIANAIGYDGDSILDLYTKHNPAARAGFRLEVA